MKRKINPYDLSQVAKIIKRIRKGTGLRDDEISPYTLVNRRKKKRKR